MDSALLKYCLAFPKISFFLSTCPPSYIKDTTDSFDTLVFESLLDLAGGPLPDCSWTKISLPNSLGGLNIHRAMLHSQATYIGQPSAPRFWCRRCWDINPATPPNSLKLFTSVFSHPGTQIGLLHLMLLIFLFNHAIFPKSSISLPSTLSSQTLLSPARKLLLCPPPSLMQEIDSMWSLPRLYTSTPWSRVPSLPTSIGLISKCSMIVTHVPSVNCTATPTAIIKLNVMATKTAYIDMTLSGIPSSPQPNLQPFAQGKRWHHWYQPLKVALPTSTCHTGPIVNLLP